MTPDEIKQRRLALGLTQQALADRIGCTMMTISRRERGATAKMLAVYEGRMTAILKKATIGA